MHLFHVICACQPDETVLTISDLLSTFNLIISITFIYICYYVVYLAVNKATSMRQIYERYLRVFARICLLFGIIGGVACLCMQHKLKKQKRFRGRVLVQIGINYCSICLLPLLVNDAFQLQTISYSSFFAPQKKSNNRIKATQKTVNGGAPNKLPLQ